MVAGGPDGGRRRRGRARRATRPTAIGFGITVEPDGGSEEPTLPASSRPWTSRTPDDRHVPTARRHRLRCVRTGGGVRRRLLGRAGDPLRGRRPARGPRRHPRRDGARRVAAADRHRLHRPQPAHLPDPAAPLRGARRRDPGVGDVALGPRRRDRPRVGRRARPARAVPGRGQPPPPGVPPDADGDPPLPPPRPPAGLDRRSTDADQTLREFLAAGRFSAYFTRHFMEPLVAAVWSCDPDLALEYPARYLFTFLEHHGMLQVFGSPTWRTVTGGSHAYVDRVAAGLPDIRTGTKVTSVLETAAGVEVTDGNGAVEAYDACVVATHPDQALRCWPSPPRSSASCSTALPYSANAALLHTDTSLLPEADGARASWNFRRVAGRTRRRHRHLRPHPAAAAADRHPLPGDPRRRRPRRPRHGAGPARLRAPDLHPGVGRRPGAAPGDLLRPARLRRRVPRVGLPRGRRPGRPRGRRTAGLPVGGPAARVVAGSARTSTPGAAVVDVRPSEPRTGDAGSPRLPDHDHPHPSDAVPPHLHPPVPHLAGRPRPPARPRPARAGPRQHRGARPPRRPGPAAARRTSRRSSRSTT